MEKKPRYAGKYNPESSNDERFNKIIKNAIYKYLKDHETKIYIGALPSTRPQSKPESVSTRMCSGEETMVLSLKYLRAQRKRQVSPTELASEA